MKRIVFFPCPFSSSRGPTLYGVSSYLISSYLWPMIQSSQLLHCSKSIIADILIDCSVGVVELCSMISDPLNQKANLSVLFLTLQNLFQNLFLVSFKIYVKRVSVILYQYLFKKHKQIHRPDNNVKQQYKGPFHTT